MKRISIVLCLSIIATILCTLQLCAPKENYHDTKGEQYWREQNEKQAFALDRKYQQSLSSLKSKGDSMKRQIIALEEKLRASKLKQHITGQKLYSLATKDSTHNTNDAQTECDSLKATVINYIQQSDSVQSYCDSMIVQLKKEVALKDTTIEACKSSYSELKQINDDDLRREQRLTDELQKAVRKNKRRTIQNKFLAGGLLVLTGIAASILLNRKTQ